MILTGLPDFSRALTLADGPVWAAYGAELWLAPATDLILAQRTDGRPAFLLSLTRPAAPFLPPEPFGVLDMTLTGRRDPAAALGALRAERPGAALAPLGASAGRLRLDPADAHVTLPAEFDQPVDLTLSGAGDARVVRHLSLDSALLMERLVSDGTAPFIANGAIGFDGVSPRVPLTLEFDPGALVERLLAGLGADAFTRDVLASHVAETLDDLPLTLSRRPTADERDPLAQTLADRIAARFCAPAPDAPGAPLLALLSAADVGHGRFIWDLAQAVRATRWIDISADPFGVLRDFVLAQGTAPLIRRSTLAALPTGAHRIELYANAPPASAGLHVLGVTLKAPPFPPHRPAAAVASAVFEAPKMEAELRLRLSPGEPLAYEMSGFAVLVDAAGVRRTEGTAAPADGPIQTLTAADFGLRLIALQVAPALTAAARLEGEARYRVDGREHAVPILLDAATPSASLALPAGVEEGEIVLTAIEASGTATLALDPLSLRSARLDLSLFPQYGPQQARISCAPPAAGGVVGVDLRAAGAGADAGFETLAFREDRTERTWRYSAASPFAPGFEWRLSSVNADAPWRLHPDPSVLLSVDPTTEG